MYWLDFGGQRSEVKGQGHLTHLLNKHIFSQNLRTHASIITHFNSFIFKYKNHPDFQFNILPRLLLWNICSNMFLKILACTFSSILMQLVPSCGILMLLQTPVTWDHMHISEGTELGQQCFSWVTQSNFYFIFIYWFLVCHMLNVMGWLLLCINIDIDIK